MHPELHKWCQQAAFFIFMVKYLSNGVIDHFRSPSGFCGAKWEACCASFLDNPQQCPLSTKVSSPIWISNTFSIDPCIDWWLEAHSSYSLKRGLVRKYGSLILKLLRRTRNQACRHAFWNVPVTEMSLTSLEMGWISTWRTVTGIFLGEMVPFGSLSISRSIEIDNVHLEYNHSNGQCRRGFPVPNME